MSDTINYSDSLPDTDTIFRSDSFTLYDAIAVDDYKSHLCAMKLNLTFGSLYPFVAIELSDSLSFDGPIEQFDSFIH